MSAKSNNRKNRGKENPMTTALMPLDSRTVAERTAEALRRGYGSAKSAVKEIGRATFANDRSAQNWFEGRCAPNLADAIELMRDSDEFFDEICRMAGRVDRPTADRLRAEMDALSAAIERARGQ